MPEPGLTSYGWTHAELPEGTLRSGESALHHWPAPSGVAVLTNLRILLASHPHPLHRQVVWERDLERIGSFAVQKTPEEFAMQMAVPFRWGFQPGTTGVSLAPMPEYFAVVVDERVVYLGHPDHCENIQKWIDELWVARREALGWPPRPPLGPSRTAPEPAGL